LVGEFGPPSLDRFLGGKRSKVATTVGVEVDGEPMVVLGLASGMVTVEQAISAGEFRGKQQDLAAVLGRD
jgi:hypothetical protein